MTDAVRVRDARPGDQAAIREVTLAAYEQYATGMPLHWEPYRRNIVTTLAAVGSAEQMVAERDGAILGAVLLFPPGRTGFVAGGTPIGAEWPEVRLLAVAPAARGGGIGRLLMQACVDRARAAGARALALHTTEVMAAAIRLYRRMGFAPAPELDFEPAPGLVVRGYLLDLDPPGTPRL